jgi:hypothetical protein
VSIAAGSMWGQAQPPGVLEVEQRQPQPSLSARNHRAAGVPSG